ncbi:MAG TPA: RidA family protein [Longimicrobiales bacterium]|nr:RidA family protein [Longimicrobiales bacterium]
MKNATQWTPVTLDAEFPPPVGAYSPAARAGNLVFVSGQVPKDPRTGAVVGKDVREQTRQVMANSERALNAAGAALQDVVSVTAYLASMDDWRDFDEVYREILRPPFPTRTTVGADLRGFLVELSLIAVVR